MKGMAIGSVIHPPVSCGSIRYRKNVTHPKDRYLTTDPRRLFVPHLHTHRRTHTHTRGHPLCVDADTMQSPMQFRAIQVRLALRTSDTVTIYPSPTHTRTITTKAASSKVAQMRGDAYGGIASRYVECNWIATLVWCVACVCVCVCVLLLREVKDAKWPSSSPLTDSSSRDPRRKLRFGQATFGIRSVHRVQVTSVRW